MPDLRRYWQEVRTLEHSLPKDVWLMSIADPQRRLAAGGPVEVGAARAAQLLHEKSHRPATDEEVAIHLAAEAAKKQHAIDDDMQRRGVAVVAISTRSPKT